MSQSVKTSYVARLTLFDAAMVVVGGIIGAGIFLNPAIVAQRVGTPALVVSAWAIGGVIALMGALCYAELGARRPHAGGGYVYLHEAFGPMPAFLYGWTLLLVASTGGIAAVAVTFASYASTLLHLGDGVVKPLAVVTIAVLTAINYAGVRPGSITVNVFTVLKLAALLLLIVTGLALTEALPAGAVAPPPPESPFMAMGIALVPVIFAYSGWHHVNEVAAEVSQPQRTLPRALLLGMALAAACYVLANLAYLSALGAAGLAASKAPASDVMRVVWGDTGSTLIAAGIACSTFGFVNLAILASSRVYQAMAENGVFFRSAATLHPRYRTPALALLVQGAWAIVLTLSGTYAQLLDYVVFGDALSFAAVVATVFVYRRRKPGAPFLTPGYPLLPGLFVLACLYVLASTVIANLYNAVIGALLILTGVPVYWLWRRVSR
ncbi:MAG TPA: amino acid permease [Haliangium sp.]|nr:amino acid permease [Haliangium sp.]